MELVDFFTKNIKPHQRQYEAIRAVAFEEGTIEEIAKRFGYTPQSLRMLLSRLLRGKHQLFPDIKRGPKGNRIDTKTRELIVKLRREEKISSKEIVSGLDTSKFLQEPNGELRSVNFEPRKER